MERGPPLMQAVIDVVLPVSAIILGAAAGPCALISIAALRRLCPTCLGGTVLAVLTLSLLFARPAWRMP